MKKILIITVLILFVTFNLAYSESENKAFSEGYAAGYRDGINKIIESLSHLEGAKIYKGNLNILADYTVIENCLFVYTEPLQYAINVDKDSKRVLIINNLIQDRLAYEEE